MTRQRSTLTHDAGLGIGGRRLRGSSLTLQGLKDHPDGIKAALQLAHFAGGIGVALAGLVCPMDELAKLAPNIRRGRQ